VESLFTESKIQNKIIYYSGSSDTSHQHGVAIIIDETNCILFSTRVMLFQLEAYCSTLNIIQVYAPTAGKEDEEIKI